MLPSWLGYFGPAVLIHCDCPIAHKLFAGKDALVFLHPAEKNKQKTKQLGKHKARALASARCRLSLIIHWFRWSLFLELLLLCLVSSNTVHCDLANSYINSGIPLGWNVCARLGVKDTHKKEVCNIYVNVHVWARCTRWPYVPLDFATSYESGAELLRLVNSGRSRVQRITAPGRTFSQGRDNQYNRHVSTSRQAKVVTAFWKSMRWRSEKETSEVVPKCP